MSLCFCASLTRSTERSRGSAPRLLRGVDQRPDILGEAGAAITAARVDEVVADARIGTDTLAYLLDIGAQGFGQGGHLVYEGDAGRQHGVGGVFGQFGTACIHPQDAVSLAVEGGVELLQQGEGVIGVGADDDAIRPQAVGDGGALLEKFGVGDHVERKVETTVGEALRNVSSYPAGGADRHSALVDHHLAPLHQAAYGVRHRHHLMEVGGPVLVRRRSDRDEDKLGKLHRPGRVCGEDQATGLMVALHQGGETGLEEGNAPLFQARDLVGIHIHAGHLVTHLRQYGGLNQPDITYSEYGDSHPLLFRWQ